MNCKRCGRNVPIRSKVCPNCGLDNPEYQPLSQGGTSQTSYSSPVNTQASGSAPKQASSASQTPAKEKFSWKKILILAAIVVGIIFLVKSCGSMKLRGTWVANDGSSITFSDSKNGYISDGRNTIDFTYMVDGDEVEIKTENSIYSYSKVIRYKFKVSGSKLTLTDTDYGTTEVFYKK